MLKCKKLTTINTLNTAAAHEYVFNALFPCILITWKVLLGRGFCIPIVKRLLCATYWNRDTTWRSDIAADVAGHNRWVVVAWLKAVLIAVGFVSVDSAVCVQVRVVVSHHINRLKTLSPGPKSYETRNKHHLPRNKLLECQATPGLSVKSIEARRR